MFESKYGVARHIYINITKAGSANHAVSADWTPAAGDVKISKDGGAAANVTNLPVAIAMGNSAIWDFSLTATEMQAAQINITVADSATKAVDDTGYVIVTYGNASAQHAVDRNDIVRAGMTALPNVAAGANGGLPLGDASGRVDIGKALGTAVTLDANNVLNVSAKYWAGTAITATSLPVATAAGAAGGVFIAGTNASLTITGATTLSDGLAINRSTSNSNALAITGNGTGAGCVITSGSGATGDALQLTAASTNGNAATLAGVGTGHGLKSTGGATGRGAHLLGGATSGAALRLEAQGGTSHGLHVMGVNAGNAILMDGGATGNGIKINGGATSGDGIFIATTSGHGVEITATGTNMHGFVATGGNGGTSDGMKLVAGTGGVDLRAAITGNITGALSGAVGSVTGAVGSVTGNVGGNVTGSVGSVVGAVGSVTGNVGGNVTGTVGSVVGAVGSVTGNVGGNVTGSVGTVATGGISAASFAAGAIDASAIATDAIGSNELAASAITEIQAGLSTLDAAGVRAAVGLASANLDTQLSTIAGYIDTEIATLLSRLSSARAGYLDNLSAGAVAQAANLALVAAIIDRLNTMLEAAPGSPGESRFTADALVHVPSGSGPSAATIADAVWDEAIAGHLASGSTGEALAAAGGAGDPWITPIPGSYAPGQAGYILGHTVKGMADEWYTMVEAAPGSPGEYRFTADALVRGPSGGLDAAGMRAAIGLASANLDTQLDAVPTAVENADALLGRNVSGGSSSGRTVKQALHFIRNKWVISGGTLTVYEVDDSTPSWTSAVTGTAGADPVTATDPA